jgi:transposase-like protein
MVAEVRKGGSMRSVASRFGVHLRTVQRWVTHAGEERLDRVDWSGSRGGRRETQATATMVEDAILALRKELSEKSDLGEHGAVALHRELLARQKAFRLKRVPSVRTIGRILERRGALDGRRRMRHVPPPKGWYLPEVAAGRAELDSFDIVEGLVIRGGKDVEVLNGVSLRGGLCASWVRNVITAKFTVEKLIEHWREHGLPRYAQFDNDTIFQGAHQWPDSFGRVTRLCLQLGIIPVFAPPRETGFQASIENYNGRWQAKVWQRFTFEAHEDLRAQSDRFVKAVRVRCAARIDAAPKRQPFPADWKFDLRKPLTGKVIYLRRTDAKGSVELLGHTFEVNQHWCHRLVRCEVDLSKQRIRIHQLRRRTPTVQPLLKTHHYTTPKKRFKD